MTINQLGGQMMSDRTFYQAMAMHALLSNPEVVKDLSIVDTSESNSLIRRNLRTTTMAIAEEMMMSAQKNQEAIDQHSEATVPYTPSHELFAQLFPPVYWQNLHWCQIAAWIEVAAYCIRHRKPLAKGIFENGVFELLKPDDRSDELVLEVQLDKISTFSDYSFLQLLLSMSILLVDRRDEISDDSTIDEV